MSTLENLRGLARGEIKNLDPNGRVWSDAEIDNAVNNALSDIQAAGAFSWPENQKVGSIQTAAGVEEYDLPTGFVSVKALRGTSSNPSVISKEQAVLRGAASGNPFAFYVYGRKIGFYPVPVASETFSMAYSAAHPKLTSGVDSQFPEEFDQAIACRAAYYVIRSRPNLMNLAEQKKRQSDDDIASLFAQNRFRASGAYGTF